MDNLSKKDRRKNMQNIRSSNTLPERLISKELRKKKIYFSTNNKNIFGKPDFVFRRKRVAVFVDSDFWHGRSGHFIMPKSNIKYWKHKIKNNQTRDKKVNKLLKKDGWKIMRIWESNIKRDINKCTRLIIATLKN